MNTCVHHGPVVPDYSLWSEHGEWWLPTAMQCCTIYIVRYVTDNEQGTHFGVGRIFKQATTNAERQRKESYICLHYNKSFRSLANTTKTKRKDKPQPGRGHISHIPDEGFLLESIGNLSKLIRPRQRTHIQKNVLRHLTEEKTQMVNKHMKRCSVVLVTREMQNKTTARGHVTPTRLGKILKTCKCQVLARLPQTLCWVVT